MVVGTGIIEIFIEGSRSLKDKRAVVKSILRRTQNEFNISIAEVGDLDHWKRGRIGFSVVGNDRGFINSKIDKVLRFIDELYLAQVLRSRIEISSLSDDLDPCGRGVHADDEKS
jgi:hypothetical protein